MTTQITDEYMQEMLSKAKTYSIMLLRRTPKLSEPGAQAIIWSRARWTRSAPRLRKATTPRTAERKQAQPR